MNKLHLIALTFFVILSTVALAQKQDEWIIWKDTKKNELPEAERNFEKIHVEPPQLPPIPQQYEPEEVAIGLPKITTKVNVIKIKDESIQKLYGNYVKVGFGNYTTPYAEAFFNNKRNEKYSYGAHLKHYSSKNGPVRFSGLSQNQADVYGRFFGKNYEAFSRISYSRERYNYYGFDKDIPASDDSIKHLLNVINVMAGVKNHKDAQLDYELKFNYFNFNNNLDAKENEYRFSGRGGYEIDKEKEIVTDLMLSISNRKDSSEISRSFFQMRPHLVMNLEKFRLKAGINIAYANDTISDTKFHLYPNVHIDFPVKENQLALFAGLHGELQRTTLRGFVAENPFLDTDALLFNTNKPLELYGGVKGNYNGLNYTAKAAYSTYRNLYFFNNSPADTSMFVLLYDKNTTVMNLEGDLSYELSERFRAGLNMNYFNYNMGSLEKPWHRPSFVTRLSGSYNLHKKIYFNTGIYYISGLVGKNFVSNKEEKLSGILDLNLKVEYKFSNMFTAYLEFNNLLSKKYQRYLYYPVKGINVLGGIAVSF